MFAFFLLFFAMYLISGIVLRLLETKTAGTTFGAALAYVH